MAAVQASLEAGERVTGEHTVDSVVIPRVHPQVIQAINLSTTPEGVNAVGVMEFYSITAAVYAADAAVKAADVTLIDVRLGIGIGGKSFAVLTGDVAGVEGGVEGGKVVRMWNGGRNREGTGAQQRSDSEPARGDLRGTFIMRPEKEKTS